MLDEQEQRLLEALFLSYYWDLQKTAYKILRDQDDAQDAVQTVFANIAHNPKGIINRDQAGRVAYLYYSVKAESFRFLKRRSRNLAAVLEQQYYYTDSQSPEVDFERNAAFSLLSELPSKDKDLLAYCKAFRQGERRERNPVYRQNEYQAYTARKALADTTDDVERGKLIEQIRQLERERMELSPALPMDAGYKRLFYVRYADDWLCGVIGSKEDCRIIKEDIKNFLRDALHLELSEEKTLITNARDKAHFLGFDIYVRHILKPNGRNWSATAITSSF